jgi:hypothetical protein
VITSRKNITEDFASDVSLQNLGGDVARCSFTRDNLFGKIVEKMGFQDLSIPWIPTIKGIVSFNQSSTVDTLTIKGVSWIQIDGHVFTLFIKYQIILPSIECPHGFRFLAKGARVLTLMDVLCSGDCILSGVLAYSFFFFL